jgi:hypothetical protein
MTRTVAQRADRATSGGAWSLSSMVDLVAYPAVIGATAARTLLRATRARTRLRWR